MARALITGITTQVQGVVATPCSWSKSRCSFSASAGVRKPSVLRAWH